MKASFFYDKKTEEVKVGNTLVFIVALGLVLVGIGWFFSYVGAAEKVAGAPAAALSRTFDTQNIVDSYEDFRDTFQAYQARVAQISSDEAVKPQNSDDAEALRTEIRGEQQSCRDLAAHYNANASKANRNIFKNPPIAGGEILPDTLDMEACSK